MKFLRTFFNNIKPSFVEGGKDGTVIGLAESPLISIETAPVLTNWDLIQIS